MSRTAVRWAIPGVVIALLAALVSFLLVTRPAHVSAAEPDPGSVTVDGTGKVTGTPDVLRLAIGVSERAGDVSTALSRANADMARLRSALQVHHVADADLQTSQVNIFPTYTDHGVVSGYQVSEDLTAKLRDLSDAGNTINAAVTAGGNAARVEGVSFTLEDNAALLKRARDAAYADAQAKAEQYAKLSNRRLAEVKKVSETTQLPVPQPYAYDAMPMASGGTASTVPVNPGSQQVAVTVTVVWALQ
jgi:uncharacterized protein YggE